MIKIVIDPLGTGTTGIVVLENNKVIRKIKIIYNNWLEQLEFIIDSLIDSFSDLIVRFQNSYEINIENCLPTNANGLKDRDDFW
ncbi:hypothetical protein SKUN_001355 [Spiroplasma kunkelii CR2-3x]|uniref:Uncharacterized protein n=1 Tax=Spiroplasma kunkelii CR2-3x TaxID=273035 RepID=A0A0K2JIG9_SPIKU|nr:hypothetical protein [Spiroplasma kunkelii]ALA98222.1 hypothetical protein SKUN_001355 [Spiroplasma kunkelii CR2-3x]